MFSFTKSDRVIIFLYVSSIVNILSHRCLVYTYSLTCKHFSPPNLLWLYQVIYHRVTVLNYDVDTLYWDYFSVNKDQFYPSMPSQINPKYENSEK